MIFVTVGTHEQSFNRLIEEVDKLVQDGIINEEVIIQKGYSTYSPKFCKCFDLISWDDMQKYNKDARIVITHGGPASFIDVLSLGKTPIIVPRQEKYNEHVNNHQLIFSKELLKRGMPIIVIDEITELKNAICNYTNITSNKFKSNNSNFVKMLEEDISKLFR